MFVCIHSQADTLLYLRGAGTLDNYLVKIQRVQRKNVIAVIFRIVYNYLY